MTETFAILLAFCPTGPHWPGRTRTNPDEESAYMLTEQGGCNGGGRSRTDPDEANPAENRKVGGSIPSLPTTSAQVNGPRPCSTRGDASPG